MFRYSKPLAAQPITYSCMNRSSPRGAHDPPAACRLRPRDWFFNRLLQRCALRLVATQPRGGGNGGLLRRRVTLRTTRCSKKTKKKRDSRLAFSVISDLRQKTQKANSQ